MILTHVPYDQFKTEIESQGGQIKGEYCLRPAMDLTVLANTKTMLDIAVRKLDELGGYETDPEKQTEIFSALESLKAVIASIETLNEDIAA